MNLTKMGEYGKAIRSLLDKSQSNSWKRDKKTRPCVIILPNEMHGLNTVIIAPMTSISKLYPTRVPLSFGEKDGLQI